MESLHNVQLLGRGTTSHCVLVRERATFQQEGGGPMSGGLVRYFR